MLVIGHPLGLESTVSTGVLSAARTLESGLSLLQITAPISQGSSGGPVLNGRGEVVGVARMLLASGQALNFATPSKQLGRLLGGEASQPFALEEFARMTKPATAPANEPAPASGPAIAPPPPPAPRLPAFPSVVAGFPVGVTPRDLLALCPDLEIVSPTLAWCPYTRVPLDFADPPIAFGFADGRTVSISLEPRERESVEAALSGKYGTPLPLQWRRDGWLRTKAWRGGASGGLQWETVGGFIRYGRDKRNRPFLSFVITNSEATKLLRYPKERNKLKPQCLAVRRGIRARSASTWAAPNRCTPLSSRTALSSLPSWRLTPEDSRPLGQVLRRPEFIENPYFATIAPTRKRRTAARPVKYRE